LGHFGCLLANSDVDADDVAILLVDNRVDGDGRLARLAVAERSVPVNDAEKLPAAVVVAGVETVEATGPETVSLTFAVTIAPDWPTAKAAVLQVTAGSDKSIERSSDPDAQLFEGSQLSALV
jgi:hypothetical protein